LNIRIDTGKRCVVTLGAGEAEEFGRVDKPGADTRQRADDAFERLLLLAELLSALRVAPDLGVAQEGFDFRQPFLLGFEVKDTSAAPPTAPAGRRAGRRSG
jgi:hypothetical protein